MQWIKWVCICESERERKKLVCPNAKKKHIHTCKVAIYLLAIIRWTEQQWTNSICSHLNNRIIVDQFYAWCRPWTPSTSVAILVVVVVVIVKIDKYRRLLFPLIRVYVILCYWAHMHLFYSRTVLLFSRSCLLVSFLLFFYKL